MPADAAPIFRHHKIPTQGSEPYICITGTDGHLWFCESGASKIGRLDVDSGEFQEFALPENNALPIGITPGAGAGAGARCICTWPDGRLFYTAFDAGLIDEIIPQ
jgi:virginiamycin B lyase